MTDWHDTTSYREGAVRLAARSTGRHPAPVAEKEERKDRIHIVGLPVDPIAVVASVGMPSHSAPKDVIANLNTAALKLDAHPKVFDLARQLSDEGYPASTLGDGGSRGTDSTSSTERAAGVTHDNPQTRHWKGVDRRLATSVAQADRAAKELATLVANIVHHATDIDPVPVGTGECVCCGRFVRPDKDRPGNRLRSGLCPTDYRAWHRAGQPQRNDWVRHRRGDFTDASGVLHTPEPDHDIDLTNETLSP